MFLVLFDWLFLTVVFRRRGLFFSVWLVRLLGFWGLVFVFLCLLFFGCLGGI